MTSFFHIFLATKQNALTIHKIKLKAPNPIALFLIHSLFLFLNFLTRWKKFKLYSYKQVNQNDTKYTRKILCYGYMWHFRQWPCSPVVSLLCFIVGSSCAWLIYPTRLLIPWLRNSWLLMWLCWYVCHLPFPFTLEIGICLPSKFQYVLLQNQHPNFDFSTTFRL